MSRPFPLNDACPMCGERPCTCPTIEEVEDFLTTRREEETHDDFSFDY